MGFHLVKDTYLQRIIDAIKQKNKYYEEEVSGAQLPEEIVKNRLASNIITGSYRSDELGYEITAEELEGCKGLIRSNAFNSCLGLNSITFPSGVTGVNRQVFYSCMDLIQVEFLGNVTFIGANSFSGVMNLQRVIFRANTGVPTLNTGNFAGALMQYGGANTGIFVPDELVEEFKVAENWAVYVDWIKPLSTLEEGAE